MRIALVFILSLACYVALGQRALYANDGFFLLASLQGGFVENTSHEAYLPLLQAFAGLTRWLDLSPVRVISLLSALGSALGVALTYVALRLLSVDTPERSLPAAALVAGVSPVVFFATVVEYHGCFFAFSQLAFLACVLLVRRASLGRAVALGIAGAGAALVHSTGWFLPLLFLPFAHAQVGDRRHRAMYLLVALVITVALALTVITLLRAVGVAKAPPISLGHLGAYPVELARRLVHVPRTLWSEWFLPFAPASWIVLWLTWRGPGRRVAIAVVASAVAYAVPSALLLGRDIQERGAYFLPLIGPMAVVCAMSLRPRVLWTLAGLGFALGAVQVVEHDRLYDEYRAVVRGAVQAAAGRRPLLLTAESVERGACTVLATEVSFVNVATLTALAPAVLELTSSQIGAYLGQQLELGRQPMISTRALAVLGRGGAGPAVPAALRSTCRFEPVVNADFDGYLLHPQ